MCRLLLLFTSFFLNNERKKPINVPIVKNFHCLERAQYVFLDHSKTLVLALDTFVPIPRAPNKLHRARSHMHNRSVIGEIWDLVVGL